MRVGTRIAKAVAIATLFIVVAFSTPTLLSNPVAAYNQHPPIVIHGNQAFTPANGVTGGKGTRASPYIIEGWEIDSGLGDGIQIEQTDAYFVIRKVLVLSSDRRNTTGAGIHFVGVVNGRIENSTISDNYYSILFTSVTNAEFVDSTFSGNHYGPTLVNAANVLAARNAILSTDEDGINVYNATDIMIAANTISNQHQGISLTDASMLRISANDISFSLGSECFCPGLRLSSGRDIEVSNNTIRSNNVGILQDYAIYDLTIVDNTIVGNYALGMAVSANNLTIMRNNVSWNGGDGISVGSAGARILDNDVSFNDGDGVLVAGPGNLVTGNVISGNGRYGIELFRATNASLHANTLTENGIYVASDFSPQPTLSDYNSHTITPDNLVNGLPVYYYKNCDGVTVNGIPIGELIVANCTGFKVSNVTMRPMEIGFEMVFVRDVMIMGNSVAGSRWEGVQVLVADNVTVDGNEISSNYFAGIEVWYATHVATVGNYISRNGFGALVGGTELSVISNDFSENDFGLQTGGTNVTIEGNNFSRNGGGIFACCTTVRVVGNNISLTYFTSALLLEGTEGRVYHNNMIENKFQGGPSSAYRYSFDDGYPSGGNYWSNYEGIDYCHGPDQNQCPGPDGIGDTPYAFPGGGADRYPLMNPYGSADWAPGAAFTISSSTGTTATVFNVDASSSWDREDPVNSLEVRWDWEGDGVWDTGWSLNKTAQHQYAAPGSYTIRLAVRDSAGLSGETGKTVTVVAPLSLLVAATPQVGEAPLFVDFHANVSGGLAPYSHSWSFGDGGISSELNPTHTYQAAGTYTATLIVRDSQGTQQSATTTVNVITSLSLAMAADVTTGTIPFAVSFNSTVSGGTPPYSFAWDFGDGGSSTEQNPSHTYQVAGTYTAKVTVTDGAGRSVTRTTTVTAAALPSWAYYLVAAAIGAAVIALVAVRMRRGRRPPQIRPPPPP